MTTYEIKPFELTPDFEECWMTAGGHLNLRVRDSGASWLRAELPPFREHLSFALGNQLFFIQIIDVDNFDNGWFQENRLGMAVKDTNGVGCLMPMEKVNDSWRPVEKSWGLVDMNSRKPLNPFDLAGDEPVLMTSWEIHDVGIQSVREYLRTNGWTIASWQSDLSVDPSIFAEKDGEFCGFVIRTSNKGPDKGKRPENSNKIVDQMRSRGWGSKFVGMKVASSDDFFDPRLEHLTRRINRRSKLLLSSVEIEELNDY